MKSKPIDRSEFYEKKWEPCPKCRSKDVTRTGKVVYLIGAIILIGIGFWIPVIGLFIIAFGVIGLLMIPFIPPKLHCHECEEKWYFYKDRSKDIKDGILPKIIVFGFIALTLAMIILVLVSAI